MFGEFPVYPDPVLPQDISLIKISASDFYSINETLRRVGIKSNWEKCDIPEEAFGLYGFEKVDTTTLASETRTYGAYRKLDRL